MLRTKNTENEDGVWRVRCGRTPDQDNVEEVTPGGVNLKQPEANILFLNTPPWRFTNAYQIICFIKLYEDQRYSFVAMRWHYAYLP